MVDVKSCNGRQMLFVMMGTIMLHATGMEAIVVELITTMLIVMIVFAWIVNLMPKRMAVWIPSSDRAHT
jgi:hypothetical protein